MKSCAYCGSYAINPNSHGRDGVSGLDLCDVCYWRKRAESAAAALEQIASTTGSGDPCRKFVDIARRALGDGK